LKNFKQALGLIFLLVLASCNTWDEKKCGQTNWRSLGLADGQKGKNNKSNYYVGKCSEFGIVNTRAYNEGYRLGNKNFCEGSQAFEKGKNGESKDLACATHPVYAVNYRKGMTYFCSYDKGYESQFNNTETLSQCRGFSEYERGLTSGQKDYCSEDNAFEIGKSGEVMNDSCSSEQKYQISKAYKQGYEAFLGNKVSLLQDDYREMDYKLAEVNRQISDSQRTLSRLSIYSSDPNVQSLRREILNDLSLFKRDRIRYENNLSELSSKIKELKRESTLL